MKSHTKGAKISAIVIKKELAELVLKLIRNVVNIQKSAIVVGKKTDVDKDELKNIFISVDKLKAVLNNINLF